MYYEKNTKNNGGFDKKIVKKTCEARIRLTKKGMLLANDVFVEFISSKNLNFKAVPLSPYLCLKFKFVIN